MMDRILFVDDEVNILDGFRVNLRKDYQVETADGPEAGLAALAGGESYAVVVSDLRMPGMDGIEFLSRVRQQTPNAVRVMLTGHGDYATAMEAVNRGHIFRFLEKPCPLPLLKSTLRDAVRQHKLVVAERELLQKTLKGTIELISEIISLVNPEAFGRSQRILRYVRYFVEQKDLRKDAWRYDLAAMLCQLGCLTLPEGALEKINKGRDLTPEEKQLYDMHPFIGANLLARIPRLEEIARMVSYQEKGFDGSGVPHDELQGEEIPLGGRMLKLALDFDRELGRHETPGKAFLALEESAGLYDPELLYYLESLLGVEARFAVRDAPLGELRDGMILYADVLSDSGLLLVRKGIEVTSVLRNRLESYVRMGRVAAPFKVLDPLTPGV